MPRCSRPATPLCRRPCERTRSTGGRGSRLSSARWWSETLTSIGSAGAVVESADDARSAAVSVLVTSGVAGLVALAEWDTARARGGSGGVRAARPDDLCRRGIAGGRRRAVTAGASHRLRRVPVPAWVGGGGRHGRGGRAVSARSAPVVRTRPTRPPSAQLARQLAVLVDAGLPFKATAGLHHAVATSGGRPGSAVANTDSSTCCSRSGALLDGASEADARRAAGLRRARAFCWPASTRGVKRRSAESRTAFRSFGCCGVTDPVGDLVALGLLGTHDEPARSDLRRTLRDHRTTVRRGRPAWPAGPGRGGRRRRRRSSWPACGEPSVGIRPCSSSLD